jgi:large subunit ribosomal protein L5
MAKKDKKSKKAAVSDPLPADYKARLQEAYESRIRSSLQDAFKIKNVMEIPALTQISLNVGLGDATQNPKALDAIAEEMGKIAGQKPVITKARKSISNFKLREGVPIGCRVTLRRTQMYEFLDRLISLALPRIRDFRGISDTGFDGRGNYSLGVKEQIIFPEINYDKVDLIHGMDITIVTTARTDEQALHLLREFGMPFQKN